ncbi:MAG: histidine phosphatase family protein [Microbacteriaceae bacterium]
MSVIALIRHGLTDWNVENRVQGVSDIPLNQAGIEQANALATRITTERTHDWGALFSSPLGRAKETASPVAHALNLEIQELGAFRERNYGMGEGLTWHEIQQRYGDDVPGRETAPEVRARALPALFDLIDDNRDKNALLVSHGGTIRAVLQAITRGHFPSSGEAIENTSIHLIHHQDDQLWMEGFEPVDRDYLRQLISEQRLV